MLKKLALSGIKSRFRDYAVLFSGLVIASAVFYMFMALATNTTFLQANSTVGGSTVIFAFGAILLAIITFVYILYANSFLMSMRQRDYAMFMMLGAKHGKIGQLIFLETITVGTLATVVGLLLGVGLTAGTGKMLQNMLHAAATGFSPFWLPAVVITLIFFGVLFLLAATFNAGKLIKTPILDLLHADQTPSRMRSNKLWFFLQVILAVVLLAIGYWVMGQIETLQLTVIPIALVTIVAGTYFLFNSLVVFALNLLKKNRQFAAKQLHTFTLSQLSFRVRDYTKILATVTILFALALGALTTGLGFKKQIPLLASNANAYDLVVTDPDAATKAGLADLSGVTRKTVYQTKNVGDVVYVDAAGVDKAPFLYNYYNPNIGGGMVAPVRKRISGQAIMKQQNVQAASQLRQFILPSEQIKHLQVKVIPSAQFAQLAGTARTATGYEVKDFDANYDAIKAAYHAQLAQYGVSQQQASLSADAKLMNYELVNSLLSGMAFMGFFLGLAFLAMLASTLMFKILSGASFDQKRYLMLQKIGVRPRALKRSIRQELGTLFVMPGVMGIVHVLFGLQLFTSMLSGVYSNLLLPFGIFLVLYLIYYLITVWLYEGIVLNKALMK